MTFTSDWDPLQSAPPQPWEIRQGLYNRTISIYRLRSPESETPSIGNIGYVGAEQFSSDPVAESQQLLYSNVPAMIQSTTVGRASGGVVPTDVSSKPPWLIVIPTYAVPFNLLRDRDIIMDDDGYRYGIGAALWTALGWNLWCIRLEA